MDPSSHVSGNRQLGPVGAASLAGLTAGTAYLVAQMGFSARLGLDGRWASLQRIGAMLLGASMAPPPGELALTSAAIALFVHLPLSALYGRLIGGAALRMAHSTAGAAVLGAVLGLLLFGVNFYVIAPHTFPWFLQVRNPATACDHVLFGALCAVLTFAYAGGARTGGRRPA